MISVFPFCFAAKCSCSCCVNDCYSARSWRNGFVLAFTISDDCYLVRRDVCGHVMRRSQRCDGVAFGMLSLLLWFGLFFTLVAGTGDVSVD